MILELWFTFHLQQTSLVIIRFSYTIWEKKDRHNPVNSHCLDRMTKVQRAHLPQFVHSLGENLFPATNRRWMSSASNCIKFTRLRRRLSNILIYNVSCLQERFSSKCEVVHIAQLHNPVKVLFFSTPKKYWYSFLDFSTKVYVVGTH